MDTTSFRHSVSDFSCSVNEFSNCVFLQSQCICATAEIEAMKAANEYRISRGEQIAYDEEAFLGIPEKYGLHHNSAIKTLRGEP